MGEHYMSGYGIVMGEHYVSGYGIGMEWLLLRWNSNG